MKIWGIVVLLFIVQFPTLSQSDIAFIASTNADEVIPGQPFEVQYEIKNVDPKSFDPPDFRPLDKVSGPNVSSSLRIVNGRRSSSKSYSFTLSAPSAGKYVIPPATAEVNGNTLNSNSLEIKVIPISRNKEVKGKEEVFLQLVPSDTSPYVGEQLVLDYVLYYSVPVENIYRMNDIDFNGFYSTSINDFPRSVKQTSINGQPYSRQIIKRVCLFGQQSGEYELGPLFLRIDIAKGDRRSPFSIFRNTEKREIYTDPLTISVKSLPERAPENFSGGVGQLLIQAKAEQQQVSMGEAVEVTIRVEGQSDPNVLDPPSLIIDGNAESYSPQLDYEDENIHRGRLSFTKTWTYLVVPEEEGKFSVQPYLIHLNTETGTYDSLMAEQLELWAKPVVSNNSDIITNGNGQETEAQNQKIWGWGIAALLIILFLATLYYRYIKGNPSQHTLKQNLEQAIQLISVEKNNPPPDLTRIKKKLEELKSNKSSHTFTDNQINRWVEKLDYHQYSPVKEDQKINALLEEILEDLRKA